MAEAAKKSTPTILPGAFGLAEHKRGDFVADIDPKVTVEEVQDPAFWSHVSAGMNPLDRIEARWEDGSKIVHLRVVFAERTYAKVKIIRVEKLDELDLSAQPQSLLHSIAWKGPMHKFAVIRNSDNMIIQDGFRERSQAASWLTEHERT